MNERTLSAPGKLFLSGEYAVLWGGAARIVAVGPRTQALARRREDREVHLLVEEGRAVGHLTPLGVAWRPDLPEPFRFAARGIGDAVRVHGHEALGFSVALGPSPLAPGGRKLGIGGSARAVVLAVEATRSMLDARFDPLKVALLSHAAAQGMRGSGGDVAAIFAGGLIRYRRYGVERLLESADGLAAALERSAPVELLRIGEPRLPLAYAFAGASASTPQLIGRVEAGMDASRRAAFVAESDALGEALEDALIRADFETVREAVEELEKLLRSLGPLETEAIERVLALARSHGSVGKLSGAGGGDGAVLFSPDLETREALLRALVSRGFFARPLAVEQGMRGEGTADPRLASWL